VGYPTTIQVGLSTQDYLSKILDYLGSITDLWAGGLRDLQFLGGAFPRRITRPSRWHRNVRSKASWLLDDVWDIRHPSPAESRPYLELLLKCLLIFIIRSVFNGDGVVTFTDFVSLLRLAFSLALHIIQLWRGGWVEDELHNIILQYTTYVSTTTSGKSVLGGFRHDY
jgi:hypothetical protein